MTATLAFILGAVVGAALTIAFAIIIAGSDATARELAEIDDIDWES